jgi:Dyp-type peroxidase family
MGETEMSNTPLQPQSAVVRESVLPMSDIQGIAVPGFLKPHQTLFGVHIPGEPAAIAAFKEFLRDFTDEIATAAQTLEDRRKHRSAGSKKQREAIMTPPLVAITFGFTGLRKLTPGAVELPGEAFRQGLAARSAFLGDPTDPTDEGNPAKWVVGSPGKELDVLIAVAGDDRDSVDTRALAVSQRLHKAGVKIAYEEKGDVRADQPGHEHFGFDDGISQPGIRGRASDAADDFITDRHIAESDEPNHSLFGYPGQDLVWPGVLLLGHPATSPDPLVPGFPSSATPGWSRNGSFLVFRRLRQDVGLFWRTMADKAQELSKLPGFAGMTDEKLASLIVGRWPSGAPVNRVPGGDNKDLGRDPAANNHFRFDSNAAELKLRSGYRDPFDQSKADPAGTTCPWAAHIRKVNTRDSGSDMGGRDSTYSRRVLRVGVPFGKSLKDRYAQKADDPEKGERGLLFLSIQASIEDQFEFLMARWMGDPSRPKMPGGHDLLVGQNNAAGENRERRCTIFGSGLQQTSVAVNAQWIIPTGGGYFFVPSLSALKEVLAA